MRHEDDGTPVIVVASPVTRASQPKTAKLIEPLLPPGDVSPRVELQADDLANAVLTLPHRKVGESVTFLNKAGAQVTGEITDKGTGPAKLTTVQGSDGGTYRLSLDTNRDSGIRELLVERRVSREGGGILWSRV